MVGRGGMKSAAEPVEPVRFTILLGFVVLLAIFVESMFSLVRPAVCVDVAGNAGSLVGIARVAFGLLAALKTFEERLVGLFSLLTFRMLLGALLAAVLVFHGWTPACDQSGGTEMGRRG
jgi:hypothetical protein